MHTEIRTDTARTNPISFLLTPKAYAPHVLSISQWAEGLLHKYSSASYATSRIQRTGIWAQLLSGDGADIILGCMQTAMRELRTVAHPRETSTSAGTSVPGAELSTELDLSPGTKQRAAYDILLKGAEILCAASTVCMYCVHVGERKSYCSGIEGGKGEWEQKSETEVIERDVWSSIGLRDHLHGL